MSSPGNTWHILTCLLDCFSCGSCFTDLAGEGTFGPWLQSFDFGQAEIHGSCKGLQGKNFELASLCIESVDLAWSSNPVSCLDHFCLATGQVDLGLASCRWLWSLHSARLCWWHQGSSRICLSCRQVRVEPVISPNPVQKLKDSPLDRKELKSIKIYHDLSRCIKSVGHFGALLEAQAEGFCLPTPGILIQEMIWQRSAGSLILHGPPKMCKFLEKCFSEGPGPSKIIIRNLIQDASRCMCWIISIHFIHSIQGTAL